MKRDRSQRDEVLRRLAAGREELDTHGVKSIAVFGSVARGESGSKSDVDILVEIGQPTGLFEFVRLHRHLEKLLERRVDLATPDGLHRRIRNSVLSEAVYAG